MSFQGDARGIGLAELLQGLARGRKEGILTLTSTSSQRAVLGIDGGKGFLLPEEGEDPERWRDRVRDAWADDPVGRADYLRMSEVARAHRLESLYCLLDGGNVHFRFDPGVLPRPSPTLGEEPEAQSDVFCEGIQIEFLLLEYARIADELEGAPEAHEIPAQRVPCVLDPTAAGGTPLTLLEACDGRSTVQEISDRLGWPIRQTRLTLLPALASGALRPAHPAELLELVYSELSARNFSRAAVRLGAWCREGTPGPVPMECAERLSNEWLSGRLTAALRGMCGRDRRTLLRRLDHTLQNPSQSVVHWLEASRVDKTDRIARLRRLAAEFKEGSDPERPGVRDLLDWAKEQQEAGLARRGAPLLVMAAHLQPSNTALQLELGTGLVAAGRPLEGAPWVIAAGKELLDHGSADRAVGPLRALLERDPRNRECRQLLSRARRQSTSARKLRKNLLIGLAATVVLAGVALVKVHRDTRNRDRLAEVRALMHTPQRARAALREFFGRDNSTAVVALRREIDDRERIDELEMRSAWISDYNEIQLECSKGEPIVALARICELEAPPRLRQVEELWPEKGDLYRAITDHLHEELQALGEPVEGAPQQVSREDQLEHQVDELMVAVEAEARHSAQRAPFLERLAVLEVEIEARRSVREEKIRARLHEENLEKQTELYQLAEAYAKSGDFQRALKCYEEIIARDTDGRVRAVLEERKAAVESKHAAVQRSRALALEGLHDEAFVLLEETFEDPTVFILPWTVTSYPAQVRVRREGGRLYTTPFAIETTLGEEVRLTFECEGFDSRTVVVNRPGDIEIHLQRSPERSWVAAGRVDAMPVSVDEDHLVADRKGTIARVGAGGEVRWRTSVRSLSGIARAPVFMPHRPGHLLLISEDGEAWIVEASSGHIEGPWNLGSPPILGPAPSAGHVRAHLADGRLVLWKEGLRPVLDDPDAGPPSLSSDEGYRHGSHAGLSVARSRSGNIDHFECPWDDWVAEIGEESYVIHRRGDRERGYSVLRHGDWAYLAWESASARYPSGRLWISDGAGLRAFLALDEHD